MGELILRVEARLFSLLAFGHVNGATHDFDEIARWAQTGWPVP
jgi:hypothetical protein